ncbi:37122_t:CDS:2 [Gigaspora margarita]|uniref:37122_t:CDS:1 n=1 Tax=Gigaspora margarita TaxID=4874 RepID=A0ABN7VJY8_GIGMA|nr:37122_t:CDS:2 [Gigaspora margarita]
MVINENPTPSRLIICDAAAKEWKNVKKMKEPEIDNIIKKYLAMPLKMQAHFRSTASSQQKPPKISKVQKTPLQIPQTFDVEEIRSNASAQKQAANSKVAVEKKIKELEAHKHEMHPSARGRPKKNQSKNSESVVEAMIITNATTLEDFSILLLQQNENCFLVDNFRECASDIEF